MKRHCTVLLTFVLALACAPARAAETQQLSWQELPGAIDGKKITVVLPDSTEVRGNVLAVEPTQLVLDVTKTSNKQAHPKGRTNIPRASVTTVAMTRNRMLWRVLGPAIGLGAGLAIAIPVNTYAHNEGDGAPAAVAAIVAVPTALGYLAGRSADRKTVIIKVHD